ncbi:MAG TPA: NADPH:quinone oxidoreductase family protein [Acidimicrobiales bacterium]|nr:NADPH:quinone oxidoreductase family protein [Acidimicrobiales bacterium]
MRAWRVAGAGEPADVMRMVEIVEPEPGPGQLRVKVTAAGIGLPDVLMCRGTYPLTPGSEFTPGQEATGVITAVGPDVGLSPGTTVMGVTNFIEGHGSFAEECLILADSAFPVPGGLTDAQSAGFWIPHLTAWVGLVDRGRLQPGDWLAVLGAAGGSGIAAVQLGQALGAQVIAVVSDDTRAQFAGQLGADHTALLGPDLASRLRELTAGQGVDLIFDPVGGAVAEEAWGALGRHGRLLAVGFASGSWPHIETHNLVLTNTSLVGVFAGGYSRSELDGIHGALSDLVVNGRLRNAVTEEVPFEELPAAVQRLADRSVIGKLVMVL